MSEQELVVGIDLGTTNSEVAAYVNGRVEVLGARGRMLPSCVGISPAGELLVGQPALNQLLLHPERSVKSVKRKMGERELVTLGERSFSPEELSAILLRELVAWAGEALGAEVKKAVITVPAYFSDAQRLATREAGALAGLEVLRVLNEPTAASLAYGHDDGARQTVMIYDLGGGTFDVSIVRTEADVTEVLASHGDTHLGGDDFDALLVGRLTRAFQAAHGVDLSTASSVAQARLQRAAEEAKRKLSAAPHARVREEALVSQDGVPLHLDEEVSREDYEALLRPLLEKTLESVSRALEDARTKPSELDAILLVGGSTRTPLIARLLEELTGIAPRQEVHPDLCVALGAGVLASRLGGHAVERVLVDVSPYSFGPSYMSERGGVPYPHCYQPIIRRNTPLPVTRTESYWTAFPEQTVVEVEIYQGEDPDALRNTRVGRFVVEGLKPKREHTNEILCRMTLDLDGILHVSAIEKETGLSKDIRIEDALRTLTSDEVEAARARLEALRASRTQGGSEPDAEGEDDEDELPRSVALKACPASDSATPSELAETERVSRALLARSRRLLEEMNDEDREDTIDLNERIDEALSAGDEAALLEVNGELEELLFFVEGRG